MTKYIITDLTFTLVYVITAICWLHYKVKNNKFKNKIHVWMDIREDICLLLAPYKIPLEVMLLLGAYTEGLRFLPAVILVIPSLIWVLADVKAKHEFTPYSMRKV